MKDITILGSGNVAHHLIRYVQNSHSLNLQQIYARSPEKIILSGLDVSKIITDLNQLQEADLYIIAVSDDAIGELSDRLPFENRLVVHTSGTAPIEVLNAKNRRGVFYPLQTFSKNKEVDFKTIPMCLEADTDDDFETIKYIAEQFSDHVYQISSVQRKSIHISAVFVNNFVNHMYVLGNKICDEHNIPFQILQPLIKETADKIVSVKPIDAQTGPAVRKDSKTIEKHLAFLDGNIDLKNLYLTLTESIQNYNV
ncbi:DUF2520 domain-containing protein [Myroides ceti]|uniref:DUF2520 domain-containing protein n=1 Tax=Paenimyroides ceti TaxID=395087 RepID=A0ABT8CS63_9FLAO|nr:DUF2520 domain-containing protein [Paenimyroides ceti]MDN3706437.1 DUF2520 domain-containing protein [Paenimyroides ceti]